jgi:serine/threonine-protein kinase
MAVMKAGRYQLLEELGRGATGVVYKAFDPTIGRTVAVKTLRLTEEGTGLARPELITRFQNEARAAGLLTHPNIVVVYDAGEDAGLFYITMEFVQGKSLHALIQQRQSFPLPRVIRIIEQACSALDYAHQRSVVHRDIKPANLVLSADDTAKITDFGTAKILQLGTTQTGSIIGTPSYISPEQVKGKLVDGRSDIFSLGVILYELVTGEKPFPGENVTTVIYKIVNEEPIPPRAFDSSIHPGLNYVITKALAKDPEQRYQSCRELSEDLKNYRALGGSIDATVSLFQPLAAIPLPQAQTKTVVTPVPAQPTPGPPAPSTPPRVEPPLTPPQPSPRPAPAVLPEAEIKPEKKTSALWLILFMLGVLTVGGYLAWPVIREILGRGKPPVSRQAAVAPVQPTGSVSKPQVALPAEGKEAAVRRAPEEKPAAQKAMEKAPAGTKVAAPSPTPPSSFAGEEAFPAKMDPAAVKSRIEQRLAQAGFGDKVHAEVAGRVVKLTGTLSRKEHRQLLRRLRGVPPGVRVQDQIQLAAQAPPGEEEERPKPAPGTGEIEIVTDILSANAVLQGPQGKPTLDCRTPCRFDELPPGRYTLEVTQEGYRPARRIVLLRAGSIHEVKINLQPSASGLLINTRPEKAEVYINGQRHADLTPTTISLAPGSYAIVVEKPGYERYEGNVRLKEDELKQLNVELVERRRSVGWLEVRTIPPGADILIDNTNTGRRTPARLELPAGQYSLTLYLKGYGVVRKTVRVEKSQTAEVNETLPRP